MKIPSIPLTIVYKVVRINRRGVYDKATNKPNPRTFMVSANAGYNYKSPTVVQYKLRHQTFPSAAQALFVCDTLEEAKKWWKMFDQSYPSCILRGYAAGVRTMDSYQVSTDPVFANHRYERYGHSGSVTLCDWFIPIGIVVKSKKL